MNLLNHKRFLMLNTILLSRKFKSYVILSLDQYFLHRNKIYRIGASFAIQNF